MPDNIQAMNEQDFMRTEPVFPLVLSMSIPMVISMLVSSLYNIVDSYYIARISEEAMTSLSLVFPIQNLIHSVAVGFGVGINAVIAFYSGAGDRHKADNAATIGLVLAIIHSVFLTLLTISMMPAFLLAFTDSETVVDFGIRYSVIAFAFTPVDLVGLVFEKIFQSVGRMKVSMAALMAGCVSNIILDPILIFGAGPFPEMGIEGAALATGFGQLISLVVYLVVSAVKPLSVKISHSSLYFDRSIVRKLYAIGIPATLNMALPSMLVSALNAILAAFSGVYILVLGIYYKLQTFLYLPASGFVQGMRPIIGYNYGAGEWGRVRRIFLTVLVMCMIIMAAGTILCMLIPDMLIGIFTSNSETIREGAEALRIISLGFIVSSVSVAASGALEGLGKGVPSLVISLLRYLVLIVPSAFVLAFFFGPVGVWRSFWISELLTALFSFIILNKAFQKRESI